MSELVEEEQRMESAAEPSADEVRSTPTAAELAYGEAVDRLMSEGRLTPADRPLLLRAGAGVEFSLDLLAPFARAPRGRLPLTPLQPASRVGVRPTLDRQRIQQIAADF